VTNEYISNSINNKSALSCVHGGSVANSIRLWASGQSWRLCYQACAAAKAQKPAFPASDLERTAAVFAALAEAARPLDAQSIATKFRQRRKIEPSVARILAAFACMGQFHTSDGARFTPRRGR
jgi:hypothetical protein